MKNSKSSRKAQNGLKTVIFLNFSLSMDEHFNRIKVPGVIPGGFFIMF